MIGFHFILGAGNKLRALGMQSTSSINEISPPPQSNSIFIIQTFPVFPWWVGVEGVDMNDVESPFCQKKEIIWIPLTWSDNLYLQITQTEIIGTDFLSVSWCR